MLAITMCSRSKSHLDVFWLLVIWQPAPTAPCFSDVVVSTPASLSEGSKFSRVTPRHLVQRRSMGHNRFQRNVLDPATACFCRWKLSGMILILLMSQGATTNVDTHCVTASCDDSKLRVSYQPRNAVQSVDEQDKVHPGGRREHI